MSPRRPWDPSDPSRTAWRDLFALLPDLYESGALWLLTGTLALTISLADAFSLAWLCLAKVVTPLFLCSSGSTLADVA